MCINLRNFTGEDNPRAHIRRTAVTGRDTWTMIAAYARDPWSGISIRTFLVVGAGVLADRLTSLPRRACDRLFAINDAEAHWRGWQIIRVYGGSGRRYRDSAFGTLAAIGETGCADR
jgi:hypothetical protein